MKEIQLTLFDYVGEDKYWEIGEYKTFIFWSYWNDPTTHIVTG